MTQEQARRLRLGLYRLLWSGGGSSLAAVGALYDGSRWYACCNWTRHTSSIAEHGLVAIATTDWSRVSDAIPLMTSDEAGYPINQHLPQYNHGWATPSPPENNEENQ